MSTDTMSFGSATGAALVDGSVFNFQSGVGIREWTLIGRGTNATLSTNRSRTSSVDTAVNSLYVNMVQYEPGTWTLGSGNVAAPVPEPASLLLMVVGVAGLLFHRRRGAARTA